MSAGTALPPTSAIIHTVPRCVPMVTRSQNDCCSPRQARSTRECGIDLGGLVVDRFVVLPAVLARPINASARSSDADAEGLDVPSRVIDCQRATNASFQQRHGPAPGGSHCAPDDLSVPAEDLQFLDGPVYQLVILLPDLPFGRDEA
ncbi:hypothetical protein OHA02_36005 [Streptomyces phaeochromogenes]|nr:hypothetical protein [Streptomyces phaeochromogenes]